MQVYTYHTSVLAVTVPTVIIGSLISMFDCMRGTKPGRSVTVTFALQKTRTVVEGVSTIQLAIWVAILSPKTLALYRGKYIRSTFTLGGGGGGGGLGILKQRHVPRR